jgi:hypothetical protein
MQAIANVLIILILTFEHTATAAIMREFGGHEFVFRVSTRKWKKLLKSNAATRFQM